MVRVITQETYDEVVKENIEEFDMSPEEAVKEATAQFEAQGVNLGNIIKEATLEDGRHLVTTIVAELKDLVSQGASDKEIDKKLDDLKKLCQIDLARRVKAAKDGAYEVLITLVQARQKIYTENESERDGRSLVNVLTTLNALLDVQPDLLDDRGLDFIICTLSTCRGSSFLPTTLTWAATCCLRHEENRQTLYDRNIADLLHEVLKEETNSKVLLPALLVVRRLCLDDDPRAASARAPERSAGLARRLIDTLVSLLQANPRPPLAPPLLAALAPLLVRAELCAAAARAAPGLRAALLANIEDRCVVQQGFQLITALSGNDDVKRELMATDLPFIVVTALNQHLNDPLATSLGLKCLSMLSLREPAHAARLAALDAPQLIVSALNKHTLHAAVQRNGCWAIRNMVSRSRELCPVFLELGAESLLNEAYAKYEKDFGFDIKSALRDLECQVTLDEPWTGKGKEIDQ